MKQRLPGILCLLAALAVSMAAARRDMSEAASFVRQNEAALTALAEEALAAGFGGDFFYPGVKRVQYSVYMEGGTLYRPYVEFHLDSLTGYSGFYYSPTDIPIPFQGVSDAALVPTASGWSWAYLGNHGATAKITDHWYSFEAWL